MAIIVNKSTLREFNMIRYSGKPPSWELIEEVIKKSKINYISPFQRVYGIPGKVLYQYRAGERPLPYIYWHIFYEFDRLEEYLQSIAYNQPLPINKEPPKVISSAPSKPIPETNKKILDEFRERFAQ